MKGLNKITLIGRLGRDPEVKATQGGQTFARTSLAVDESYTKEGRKVERTEWFNLVVWGKLAEIAGQYLSKGSLVWVEGKVQTREWQDQGGEKKRSTEVIVQDFIMLDGRKPEAPVAAAAPVADAAAPVADEDIPF